MAVRKKIYAVDLFCGIGGLTHGLKKSGIRVNAGVDIEKSCKYIYEKNNKNAKYIEKDIREIKFGDLLKYYTGADIKVLVGCAPCQPFSSHTRRTFSEKKIFHWLKSLSVLSKKESRILFQWKMSRG